MKLTHPKPLKAYGCAMVDRKKPKLDGYVYPLKKMKDFVTTGKDYKLIKVLITEVK